MKKNIPIHLIILFLYACAPTVVPTQITNVPSLESTSSNVIPTEKPVTSTPDPMASAPDGATAYENGNYIKVVTTENKNEVIYTWDSERELFFRTFVEEVPLLDIKKDSNEAGMPDQMWLSVYIDNQILNEIGLPTLTHPKISDDPKVSDWTKAMRQHLSDNLKARGLPTDQIFLEINNGELYFTFDTKEGPQKWILGPNTNVTVHIRGDYEELLKEIDTNGFSKARDIYTPDRTFNSDFIVRYWTDDKGNLYCDIAPNTPADKWTQRQILEMILFTPMNIIEREDQLTPGPYNLLSQYVQTWATHSKYPYFEFGPPR